MSDFSNADHWGELASDLGTDSSAEPAQKDDAVTSEPAVTVPPKVATEPETAAATPPPRPPRQDNSPTRVEPFADGLTPPADEPEVHEAVPADESAAPAAGDSLEFETEQEPAPDFLEAVRRESERAEAVQQAAWPVTPVSDDVEPTRDAGESFRMSPEPPLEPTTETPTDEVTEETTATADEAEAGDDENKPEEKTGRRRRRRRGRRGGRSKKGGSQDEAAQEESKTSETAGGTSETAGGTSETAGGESAPPISDQDDLDVEVGDESTEYTTEDADPQTGGAGAKHRNIPTWPEAIGMVVDANLEARSTSPSADRGRGRGRGGRGGRRRGRSSSK